MQPSTFIVCFIISFMIVYLNGSIHNDNFDLYKLFQKRKSSDFTKDQQKFQNQMLDAHNTYRSRHCASALKLDDDMSRSAQKYAEHLASTHIFEHSDEEDFGENLFKMSSTRKINNFDGATATSSWYDEIKFYDFKDPKFSEEAGHFTQVVWKESEKLGVGYATSKEKSRYALTHDSMYHDRLVTKTTESINCRNVFNLHQSLKRNKRDFNDKQRQFQNEILEAHNNYRSRHCASAQQYAEYLVNIDTLQHSGTSGVGENLWMKGSSDEITNVDGNEPTDAWYNEVEYYNYDQSGFSMQTGPFTQVVWKNTEKVGAGIAYNDDRTKVYVVAQYSPPSNYEGQFEDTVVPANC